MQAILCWGNQWSGHHILFYYDNLDVVTWLTSGTCWSRPSMMLVWFISMMAASLCLSYSCVWISSEENLLADAASHFQYDMLFQLAQYLHPKLSIPKSHLIGMKHTLTFLDESASTCGMDSHPALTKHIQQDSGPTSTLSGSILVSSSALGSSSLPLPMAYSSGLPASVIQ